MNRRELLFKAADTCAAFALTAAGLSVPNRVIRRPEKFSDAGNRCAMVVVDRRDRLVAAKLVETYTKVDGPRTNIYVKGGRVLFRPEMFIPDARQDVIFDRVLFSVPIGSGCRFSKGVWVTPTTTNGGEITIDWCGGPAMWIER